MSNWSEQIQEDLAWREAEMGSLKLLAASAPSSSDRQKALLRACCALLYAHYEGFSKFCWELLLSHVATLSLRPNDLIEPLALRAMRATFAKLRGDTSDASLWEFGSTDFARYCSMPASLPVDVDTKSNLWPSIAAGINESLGLKCQLLDQHKTELGQLVGRRNEIAHGQKLEIASLAQFQQFENSALLVMHELAIAVVDALDAQAYLRSHPRVAVPLEP
jgi:hypothetical protein